MGCSTLTFPAGAHYVTNILFNGVGVGLDDVLPDQCHCDYLCDHH